MEQSKDIIELVVSEVFSIKGRGTAVFFAEEPHHSLPWMPHQVRVIPPDGETFETTAFVEFARKVPPGEVISLRFPQHTIAEIPKGSRILFLSVADIPNKTSLAK